MKNRYEIKGDHVILFLEQKNGTVYETMIDQKQLIMLNPLNVKWTAVKWTGTKGVYVQGTLSLGNGKYETLILHRILTNSAKGKIVDHINHNTLDNRSQNLRVVSKSQNNQNKSGMQSTNTSGVRGVSWNEKRQNWRVQTNYEGKKLYLGSFKELTEAKKCFDEFLKRFFLKGSDSPNEEKKFTQDEILEYVNNSRNGYRAGKSGKKHIHFHKLSGKWSVVYNRVHYGLFDTIEDSEKMLQTIIK